MNEPAIFYSEETLKKTFAKIDEYRTQNLDISSFFAFKNLVPGFLITKTTTSCSITTPNRPHAARIKCIISSATT